MRVKDPKAARGGSEGGEVRADGAINLCVVANATKHHAKRGARYGRYQQGLLILSRSGSTPPGSTPLQYITPLTIRQNLANRPGHAVLGLR